VPMTLAGKSWLRAMPSTSATRAFSHETTTRPCDSPKKSATVHLRLDSPRATLVRARGLGERAREPTLRAVVGGAEEAYLRQPEERSLELPFPFEVHCWGLPRDDPLLPV
jgi:hypothetical protein